MIDILRPREARTFIRRAFLRAAIATGVGLAGASLLPRDHAAALSSPDIARSCEAGQNQIVIDTPDSGRTDATYTFKNPGECIVFAKNVQKTPGYTVVSITPVT